MKDWLGKPTDFDSLHENCPGVPWDCWSCGARQCPRCHVSPAEYTHCATCDDFIVPGGAA